MEKTTLRSFAVVVGACLGLAAAAGSDLFVSHAAAQSGDNRGWAAVDCDAERAGALQRAIDRARSGDTIHVAGTCVENVAVPTGKDLLTLDGGGSAAITGP